MSRFVSRYATRIALLLVAVAMTVEAEATQPVWEATVQVVSPTQRPTQGWQHQRTTSGAVLGAAIGALAARNSSHEKRAMVGLVGGMIGAGIGSRQDRRPIQGWDVVVCNPPSSGWNRCETLFLNEEPWFRAGDRVYVANDRIIYAGRSEVIR